MQNVVNLPHITPAVSEPVATMSSLEIAELTGKRHDHVKRDIEKMCHALQIDVSTFAHIYFDGKNRQQTHYKLPRRECEILVCGYDVNRRAAVIDRWMSLEQRLAKPMTQMEMVLVQAQAIVNAERQLVQQNNRIDAIEKKIEKVQDLTEQLLTGYLPIRVAWRDHANVCSYEIFREFVTALQVPLKPLVHVPDGTVVVVRTHQIKVVNAQRLANHIKKYAVQVSTNRWEHPNLNCRFKLRG